MKLIDDSSFRADFDLLKFRFIEAKKSRHFDNLIGTNEVRRIGAEFLHTRSKLAAPHCPRNVQPYPA